MQHSPQQPGQMMSPMVVQGHPQLLGQQSQPSHSLNLQQQSPKAQTAGSSAQSPDLDELDDLEQILESNVTGGRSTADPGSSPRVST